MCDCWWNLLVLACLSSFFVIADNLRRQSCKWQMKRPRRNWKLLKLPSDRRERLASNVLRRPQIAIRIMNRLSIHVHSPYLHHLFIAFFSSAVSEQPWFSCLFEIAGQCSSCKTKRCKICAKLPAIWNTEKTTQTFSGKFVTNGNAKLFQRKQQFSCHSHSLNYISHFRNFTSTKPYIRSARSLNLTSS